MGREFELKFSLTPEKLETIRQEIGDFAKITMETVYYDTANASLEQRRWMLRCRKENGEPICTLKTPLPDGSRGEWEVPCGDIGQGIDLLVQAGAPKEIKELTSPGVVPTCGARFTRLARTLDTYGTIVELALDEGVLFAGEAEQALCELEVELKQGRELEAALFARELAVRYGLTPESASKIRRAQALRGKKNQEEKL